MGLLDFICKNKKKEEQECLEREHQADLRRKENERIVQDREARLAENLRKEAARKALQEKEELESLASELLRDRGYLVYKEDKYSEMIRSTNFNPFRLTVEPSLNRNLRLGNMVDIFKQELEDTIKRMEGFGMPIDEIIGGYIFNMIESYYNNAGYVPKVIVDDIIEQIYTAIKKSRYAYSITDISEMKYRMYWNLTHQ